MVSEIHLGPKARVAEGKTKIIYAVLQPHGSDWEPTSDLAYMVHKDDITAGDGERRDVIEGKGVLSCRTTSAVYRFLETQGIPTHYVDTLDERTMLVRRVEMIPIEWVARRLATGSYVRRTGVDEGTRFDPIVLEMFLKDDARHDPQITPDEAVRSRLCTEDEVAQALQLTERVFLALEGAWSEQDVQLVDLKIELGRVPQGLVVADVIDNDSWRLWPGGRREAMLDKQVYRNLAIRDAEALDDVRRRYVEVAERAERLGSATAGQTEPGVPLG